MEVDGGLGAAGRPGGEGDDRGVVGRGQDARELGRPAAILASRPSGAVELKRTTSRAGAAAQRGLQVRGDVVCR